MAFVNNPIFFNNVSLSGKVPFVPPGGAYMLFIFRCSAITGEKLSVDICLAFSFRIYKVFSMFVGVGLFHIVRI